MKIRLFIFAILLHIPVFSQNYTGIVVGENDKPLSGGSIILMGGGNGHSVLAFSKSNDKGVFTLPEKKDAKSILFNFLGYARYSIPISEFKNGQTISLNEKTLKLKEVVIKAPNIRLKGDTITYSALAFTDKKDKKLREILEKMPGISVDKDGSVSYQGLPINKFYIEGMDLLGDNYNQATNNLSADKVKSVQVYEHHQPIKIYRDKTFSEQAAINIVLKDDAKNVWQGLLDVGLGSTLQGKAKLRSDSRVMATLFAKKMQSFSMYKYNNIGSNIKKEIDPSSYFGFNAPIESQFIGNLSTSSSKLDESKTLFNNTHVIASNWLFKTKEDNDFRIQLSGLIDKNTFAEYEQKDYSNTANNTQITDIYSTITIKQSLSADIMYKINKDSLYFINTVKAGINNRSGSGISTFNGNIINLETNPKKRYIADNIEFTKSLKNGRDVSIKAYFSYNNLPESLLLIDNSKQILNMNSIYWGATSYFAHRLGILNMKYSIEDSGYNQNMSINTVSQKNKLLYTNNELIFTPELFQFKNNISWDISVPIKLLTQRKGDIVRNNVLLETALSLIYKPSARWSINSSYSYRQSELGGISTYNIPLYTSYNTIKEGSNNWGFEKTHDIGTFITYRNISLDFFSNFNVSYTYMPNRYLYENFFNGNIITYKLSNKRASVHNFSTGLNISKSIVHMLTLNLGLSLDRYHYNYLIGNDIIPAVMQDYKLSINMHYRANSWFSIDESSYMYIDRQFRDDNRDNVNKSTIFNHELKVNLVYKNMIFTSQNNIYHGNDGASSFNYFSDIKLSYDYNNKEFSFILNNIFGTQEYRRKQILSNLVVNSINYIRPREFILKYSTNF